jgi:type VI secretion system protein ImpC
VSLYLLDVTREELAADLGGAGSDSRASALWKALGGDVPGREPWSLFVGSYAFGPDGEDLRLLEALGAVGSQEGAPFLAAADRRLLGCSSEAELADPAKWHPSAPAWRQLRASPVAPWLGLALPRVLLRLPYGPKRDPIEAFAFDEVGSTVEHEAFLWGNPAFVCAWLIGQAYQTRGWSMAVGDVLEVGDLPAFTYDEGGERKLLPCGEVWLGERAGEALLERGLMPLLSRHDRNAVHFLRLQSLAEPPQALAGPWRK